MLHLYGLPPSLWLEQGGHANCKFCYNIPSFILFDIALPRLSLNIEFRIFRSLALILRSTNSHLFSFMQDIAVLGRVTVTVVNPIRD